MEEENRKNAALAAKTDGARLIESHLEYKVDDSDSDESTCEYDLLAAAAKFELEHQGTESESSAAVDTTRSEDSESTDSDTHVRQTYVLNASSSLEDLLDSGRDSPWAVESTPAPPEMGSQHDHLNAPSDPLQHHMSLDPPVLSETIHAADREAVTAAVSGVVAAGRTSIATTGSTDAAAAGSGPVLTSETAGNALAAAARAASLSQAVRPAVEVNSSADWSAASVAEDGDAVERADCFPLRDTLGKQAHTCDGDADNCKSASGSDILSEIFCDDNVASNVSSERTGSVSSDNPLPDLDSASVRCERVVGAVVSHLSEVGVPGSWPVATGDESCTDATNRDAAVPESCATDSATKRDGDFARQAPVSAVVVSESRTKSGLVKLSREADAVSDFRCSVPTESVALTSKAKGSHIVAPVSSLDSKAPPNEIRAPSLKTSKFNISPERNEIFVRRSDQLSSIADDNDTIITDKESEASGPTQTHGKMESMDLELAKSDDQTVMGPISDGAGTASTDVAGLTVVRLAQPVTTEVKGDLPPVVIHTTSAQDHKPSSDLCTDGRVDPEAMPSATADRHSEVNSASTLNTERTAQKQRGTADSAQWERQVQSSDETGASRDGAGVLPSAELFSIDSVERSCGGAGDGAAVAGVSDNATSNMDPETSAAQLSAEMSEALLSPTDIISTQMLQRAESGCDVVSDENKSGEDLSDIPHTTHIESDNVSLKSSKAVAPSKVASPTDLTADDSASASTTSDQSSLIHLEPQSESNDSSNMSQDIPPNLEEFLLPSKIDASNLNSPACDDVPCSSTVTASAVPGSPSVAAGVPGPAQGGVECSRAVPGETGTDGKPVLDATAAAETGPATRQAALQSPPSAGAAAAAAAAVAAEATSAADVGVADVDAPADDVLTSADVGGGADAGEGDDTRSMQNLLEYDMKNESSDEMAAEKLLLKDMNLVGQITLGETVAAEKCVVQNNALQCVNTQHFADEGKTQQPENTSIEYPTGLEKPDEKLACEFKGGNVTMINEKHCTESSLCEDKIKRKERGTNIRDTVITTEISMTETEFKGSGNNATESLAKQEVSDTADAPTKDDTMEGVADNRIVHCCGELTKERRSSETQASDETDLDVMTATAERSDKTRLSNIASIKSEEKQDPHPINIPQYHSTDSKACTNNAAGKPNLMPSSNSFKSVETKSSRKSRKQKERKLRGKHATDSVEAETTTGADVAVGTIKITNQQANVEKISTKILSTVASQAAQSPTAIPSEHTVSGSTTLESTADNQQNTADKHHSIGELSKQNSSNANNVPGTGTGTKKKTRGKKRGKRKASKENLNTGVLDQLSLVAASCDGCKKPGVQSAHVHTAGNKVTPFGEDLIACSISNQTPGSLSCDNTQPCSAGNQIVRLGEQPEAKTRLIGSQYETCTSEFVLRESHQLLCSDISPGPTTNESPVCSDINIEESTHSELKNTTENNECAKGLNTNKTDNQEHSSTYTNNIKCRPRNADNLRDFEISSVIAIPSKISTEISTQKTTPPLTQVPPCAEEIIIDQPAVGGDDSNLECLPWTSTLNSCAVNTESTDSAEVAYTSRISGDSQSLETSGGNMFGSEISQSTGVRQESEAISSAKAELMEHSDESGSHGTSCVKHWIPDDKHNSIKVCLKENTGVTSSIIPDATIESINPDNLQSPQSGAEQFIKPQEDVFGNTEDTSDGHVLKCTNENLNANNTSGNSEPISLKLYNATEVHESASGSTAHHDLLGVPTSTIADTSATSELSKLITVEHSDKCKPALESADQTDHRSEPVQFVDQIRTIESCESTIHSSQDSGNAETLAESVLKTHEAQFHKHQSRTHTGAATDLPPAAELSSGAVDKCDDLGITVCQAKRLCDSTATAQTQAYEMSECRIVPGDNPTLLEVNAANDGNVAEREPPTVTADQLGAWESLVNSVAETDGLKITPPPDQQAESFQTSADTVDQTNDSTNLDTLVGEFGDIKHFSVSTGRLDIYGSPETHTVDRALHTFSQEFDDIGTDEIVSNVHEIDKLCGNISTALRSQEDDIDTTEEAATSACRNQLNEQLITPSKNVFETNISRQEFQSCKNTLSDFAGVSIASGGIISSDHIWHEFPKTLSKTSYVISCDQKNFASDNPGVDGIKSTLTPNQDAQPNSPELLTCLRSSVPVPEKHIENETNIDKSAFISNTSKSVPETNLNSMEKHVSSPDSCAISDMGINVTEMELESISQDRGDIRTETLDVLSCDKVDTPAGEDVPHSADPLPAFKSTATTADEIRDPVAPDSTLMVTELHPVQSPALPESLATRDGSGGAGDGKTRYNREPAPASDSSDAARHTPAGQGCRGDEPAGERAGNGASTPDSARCGTDHNVWQLASRAEETSSATLSVESEVKVQINNISTEHLHTPRNDQADINLLDAKDTEQAGGLYSVVDKSREEIKFDTTESKSDVYPSHDYIVIGHGSSNSVLESCLGDDSGDGVKPPQSDQIPSSEKLHCDSASVKSSASSGVGALCGVTARPASGACEVTPLTGACESDRPAAGGADEAAGSAAARGFVSVVSVGAAGSTVVHTACDGQQRSPVAPVTVTTPASQHSVSVNSATVEVGSRQAAAAAAVGEEEDLPALPQTLVDDTGPPTASEEVEVVTDDKTNSVLVSGRDGDNGERAVHRRMTMSRSGSDEVVQMSVTSAEAAPSLADYFAGLDAPSPGLGRRSHRTPEIRHSVVPSDLTGSGNSEELSQTCAPDDFDDGFDFGGGEKDEYRYDHFDSDERYSMEEPESMSDTSREEESFPDDDLRGNNRPIDFTLTTILEESCEDSDSEGRSSKERTPTVDPSELEKYFFFDIGDGNQEPIKSQAEESEYSDTSFSEISQSLCTTDTLETDDQDTDPADQAATLFFNKGFGCDLHRQPSIRSAGDDSEVQTDGSGSVGSDSEGQPSPEQRRKKVTRSRFRVQSGDVSGSSGGEGTAREMSEQSGASSSDDEAPQPSTEGGDESAFEKSDGQFDTIKRRKKKKVTQGGSDHSDREALSEKSVRVSEDAVSVAASTVAAVAAVTAAAAVAASTSDAAHKQKDKVTSSIESSSDFTQLDKTAEAKQSRDSGFLGSSDDLLKESILKETEDKIQELTDTGDHSTRYSVKEEGKNEQISHLNDTAASAAVREFTPFKRPTTPSSQADTSSEAIGAVASSPSMKNRNKVIRKDSFNNWSSDEETNILMGRLRQFFRANILNGPRGDDITPGAPAAKPAQLVSFENELTRMMKSVPGIKEAQVREIVEYLSSEDTWSDSYDSSDYTSSDLEGAYAAFNPSQPDFITQIQKQISHSCQQIIQKYETSDIRPPPPPEPPRPSVPPPDDPNDAVAVYERLMGSLRGLSTEAAAEPPTPAVPESPPMFAKVMQHVGQRLVALMHEVSSGGDSTSLSDNSPNMSVHLPRARDFFNESYTSSPKLGSRLLHADPTSSPDITPGHSPTVPRGVGSRNSGRSGYHRLMAAPPAASDDNILASLETTASPTGPRKSIGSSGSIDFNKILRDSKRKKKKEFDSCHNLVEQKDTEEEPNLGRPEDKWTRLSGRVKSEGDVSVKSCGSGSTLTIGRPRSSEFSSSEQVDSDSTLRAADSYDKHIGQRSTPRWFSSRSSLGSKNSLNTSLSSETITARPEASDSEPEDKKPRRFLFQYRRRSSVPDTSAVVDPDVRSTTLPRSTAGTGNTVPPSTPKVAGAGSSLSLPRGRVTPPHKAVHLGVSSLAADASRSARYRPPGYRAAGPTSRKTSLLGARRSSWSHKDEPAAAGGRAAESPLAARSSSTLDRRSVSSLPISEPDDDIDRLVAIHQQRSSTLSTLGSRSDSLASVYSAGEARYGTVLVRGELELALQYNYQASVLEVSIKQCRDLAAVDAKRNRSDPYVKAYLLPDRSKSGKRKTKTKKHTLHPVFEEVLKFPAAFSELESRTLWVTVWHSDIFGRNDFLGEVVLPVTRHLFQDVAARWYTLQERSEIQEEVPGHRGDVIVALKYTPPDGSLGRKGRKTRGRLHVMVKEAKNLAPVRSNGSADPFCKCYLLPDRKSSKQKTPVVKRTTCPRWSGALTYESVSLGELRERALELTIWDHSITSNEFLGGARFNLGTGKQQGRPVEWMDGAGQEVALWEQMIERPGYWVEGSVPLRCTMERTVPPQK